MNIDLKDIERIADHGMAANAPCQISGRELKVLLQIVNAAVALETVYPSRCIAAPEAKHPDFCHCGNVVLAVAVHGRG